MLHRLSVIDELFQRIDPNPDVLFNKTLETILSLSSALIPEEIMGWSETSSNAPVGISFANPTSK